MPLPFSALNTETALSPETPDQAAAVAAKHVNLQIEEIPGQANEGTFASASTYYLNVLQSLPAPTDDVERDFGLDVYERMQNDSACSSSLDTIAMQVLSEGVRFEGAIPKPTELNDDQKASTDYNTSEEIKTAIESMMNGLQQPLLSVLLEMLDCLAFGHALAEQVYEPRIVNGEQRTALKSLRVKNRRRFCYVIDRFNQFVGAVPVEIASGMQSVESVIPRSKFWHLAIRTRGGNPRGRSLLRRAYTAWYMKQATLQNYHKFMELFATPSLVGMLPPDAQDLPTGNIVDGLPETKPAAEVMQKALAKVQNGACIVVGNQGDVKALQIQGDGAVFINALDRYDRDITRAILLAVRSVMEAQYGSKADSGTAQDIVDLFVGFIQATIEETFYRDVIMPLVRLNWGDDAVERFSPRLYLRADAQRDPIEYGNMVASLSREGLIDDSQLPSIDEQIGLPPRDMAARILEKEAEKEQQRQQQEMYGKLVNPAAGVPPVEKQPAE